MIKWVAAILGYFVFRFPGALLGFFVGSLIDSANSTSGGIKSVIKDATRQQV